MEELVAALAILCLLFIAAVALSLTAAVWIPSIVVSTIALGIEIAWRKSSLKDPKFLAQIATLEVVPDEGLAIGTDYSPYMRRWTVGWVRAKFVGYYAASIALIVLALGSSHSISLTESTGNTIVFFLTLALPAGLGYWIGRFVYRSGASSIQKSVNGIRTEQIFQDPEAKISFESLSRLANCDDFWNTRFAGSYVDRLLTANRASVVLPGIGGVPREAFPDLSEEISDLAALLEEGQQVQERCLGVLEEFKAIGEYWGVSLADRLGDRLNQAMALIENEPASCAEGHIDEIGRIDTETRRLLVPLMRVTGWHTVLQDSANGLNGLVITSGSQLYARELEAIHQALGVDHYFGLVSRVDEARINASFTSIEERLSTISQNLTGNTKQSSKKPPTERCETGKQTIADAWNTFNLPATSSFEQAQRVYRALAKIYHPDVAGNEEGFKRISEAWELIRASFGR